MLRAVQAGGQARPDARPGDARADPRDGAAAWSACRRRACSTRCSSCCSPGHASACLRQLREVGLHKGVLPLLDVILEQPLGERFVTLALAQTDERVLTGPAGVARFPVRRPALARGAGCLQGAPGARRAPGSGARGRDGRGARHAVRQARHHAPPDRDDARGLGDAAALREPLGQPRLPPARVAALPHGLRLPRAARGERRGARRARGLVARASRAPTPRRARRCSCPRPGRAKRRRRRRKKPPSDGAPAPETA